MRSKKDKLFSGAGSGAILLAALIWLPSLTLDGQNGQPTQPTQPTPPAGSAGGRIGVGPPEDEDNPVMHRAATLAQMKRNEQRQQQIVKDTDRLLELAQQLKVEVAKSDKNTLSLSVSKKAEEIEKLARSVKDKMKAE